MGKETKCCFISVSSDDILKVRDYLKQVLQGDVILGKYKEYPAIYVSEKEYEKSVTDGTNFIMKSKLTNLYWLDFNQTLIHSDAVPIFEGKFSILQSLYYTDPLIEQYANYYSVLLEKDVYYIRDDYGVSFYVKREIGLEEKHNELIATLMSSFKKDRILSIFSGINLKNFFGKVEKEIVAN